MPPIWYLDYSIRISLVKYHMLADAVRRFRTQKGLSQDKLSKLAGVTLATLVKIESGANDNPKLKTLKAIADALEVSVCDLIES